MSQAPRVRCDYDELTNFQKSFDLESVRTRETLHALRHNMEVLMQGDWVGQGANAFYVEMDSHVLPSLKRLAHAMEEAAHVIKQISQLYQTAETEASQILQWTGSLGLNGLGAPSPAAQSFAYDPAHNAWLPANNRDGGLNGWPPSQKNAIYINGIQTSGDDHRNTLDQIERQLGKRVMGIYNKTEGKPRGAELARDLAAENFSLGGAVRIAFLPGAALGRNLTLIGRQLAGLAQDLYQTAGDITEAAASARLPGTSNAAVDSLVEQIKNHRYEPNTPLDVYAHSQGAAITSAALWRLQREGVDLSRLNVVTFGGAGFSYPPGPKYEHDYRPADPLTGIAAFSPNVEGTLLPLEWVGPLEGHSVDRYIDQHALRQAGKL